MGGLELVLSVLLVLCHISILFARLQTIPLSSGSCRYSLPHALRQLDVNSRHVCYASLSNILLHTHAARNIYSYCLYCSRSPMLLSLFLRYEGLLYINLLASPPVDFSEA